MVKPSKAATGTGSDELVLVSSTTEPQFTFLTNRISELYLGFDQRFATQD
jgi:hypothetical protein